MLSKVFIIKDCLRIQKFVFSSFSKAKSEKRRRNKNKKGNIYIKSTKRNIFCSLMDFQTKKIKTSCSLKVPAYENEFNEKEKLYDRGVLLGELFGDRVIDLGFRKVAIYLNCGLHKGRRGVLEGLGNKRIKISFIELSKAYPHNGCRPSKIRRKKIRTKAKNR